MKNLFIILLPLLFVATIFSSCQKDTDPCIGVTCSNAGTCIDGTCDCLPGYSGTRCEIEDLCFNVTCINGGTCINGTCDCPTGYSGFNCGVVMTPVSMTITRIDVTNYPALQSNGAGWDISSGADPFITFNSGTSANDSDFVSLHYTDVTGQDLVYGTTAGFPITVPALNSNWTIALWDDDDPNIGNPHDLMEGGYFQPIDYSTGFPSSFQISNTNFTAIFYVTWNF